MKIQNYTVPDFLGRDTKDCIAEKIQTILNNMRTKGIVYMNRRDCITGYAVHELYDWDLYFETLFLSHFGVFKFCRNNVELFLDTQHPSGFVSRAFCSHVSDSILSRSLHRLRCSVPVRHRIFAGWMASTMKD